MSVCVIGSHCFIIDECCLVKILFWWILGFMSCIRLDMTSPVTLFAMKLFLVG